MSFDGKAFGAEMTSIVKGYVDRATAPLVAENKSLAERLAALEARPVPIDGKDGRDGIDGKDGVGMAGAFRDHSGVLVLTLTDGTVKEVGNVNGADGKDGRDGTDGKDGEPGKDGFGLDDFDVNVVEDGRTVEMSFGQGDSKFSCEMKFPVPIYRGVYKEGEEYEAGDMATWGGSLWHCKESTTEKPEVGPWQLAVKKGQNGKDAK